MAFKLMVVVLLATVVYAQHNAADEWENSPSYEYSYSVQDNLTGDNKRQHETRHGNDVRGSYSLVDPDGTRRIVDYRADDDSGFRAEVRRESLDDPIQQQLQQLQQQHQQIQEIQQRQQQQQLQQQIQELAHQNRIQQQQQQQQQSIEQNDRDNQRDQEQNRNDQQDNEQRRGDDQDQRREEQQREDQRQDQRQIQRHDQRQEQRQQDQRQEQNQHQQQSINSHSQTQTQTIQRIELPVLQGIPRTILTVQDLVAPALTTVRRVSGHDQAANQQQETRVQARLSFRSPGLSYQY